MKQFIAVSIAFCASAAVAQCVRIGAPLSGFSQDGSITADSDPDQLGAVPASPVADPVLDISLPKLMFDAGDPVVLATHLHTRAGTDVDGGDVTVIDQFSKSNDPHTQFKKPMKGQAQGHGKHAIVLDNAPGEHFLTVSSDAVINGNSVHRAIGYSYVVSTGSVKFIDVGTPRSEGESFIVPLKVICTKPGGEYAFISAVLASGQTAVARSDVGVNLKPGASTVDMPFNYADLVESGPYRLVEVFARESDPMLGPQLAAAPRAVGKPFDGLRAGTGHEPTGEGSMDSVRRNAPPIVPTPYGQGDTEIAPDSLQPDAPEPH
jgi:hypothetical protein